MADADAIYELAQRIESNIEVDKRVAALKSLQSQLELAGYVVEADAVTSAVKVALKHANQALSTASLSFIPTYASMIYSGDGSESHSILNHNVRMLVNSVTSPAIEKLGDQKERIREAARTALIEIGNAAYAISSGHLMTTGKGKETETPLGIFERTLREAGLAAKFARIREQTVLLMPILRENCEKYPVRPLLPTMVDLLSDADATVREGARSTLVALFSSAAPAAKADLKKELEKKAVRKQTADGILREVLGVPSAAVTPASVLSPPAPTSSVLTSRNHTASSYGEADTLSSLSRPAPSTGTARDAPAAAPTASASAAATAAADDIRPVYIASRSDLERTFATMMPFFENRESEHNWLNREQSMIKIRGLIISGAHRQFGEPFFVGQLKTVQEGILKCVASLRTTLSMHAVHLAQELAIELGDDLGPCVEGFLINLTAMAGFTKKLIANATQQAAAAIMVNVSFRPLFLQLIWQGTQDKNVATRTAAAEHLCTLLTHHAPHRKHAVESHGGLDLLDKCLRKGVGDSNPGARTKSREAFWIFHRYWPDQANTILNSLDPATKKQVAAMAPPDVESEIVAEVRPKATVGPARARPGGASMALMQAKKAAALKAAQEKQEQDRRRAEEAAAAHEARVEAARVALAEQQRQQQHSQHHHHHPGAPTEEYATPVAAHKKSTGFMPARHHSQQSSHLKPSTELSVLVSPTAHQRIETAVALPLPTSPSPAPSAHDTPQARANSKLSQPSFEASPLRTRSPGLSPRPIVSARNRAVSSSSLSSHGSGSASSARHQASSVIPQRTHRAPSSTLDADLDDLSLDSIQDDDDTADATQQPRFHSSANGEDDTVQLTAPEDASMDLMGMNFNSPFKIPSSAGVNTRSAKTQSVLVERQNALKALESATPQRPKTDRTVSTSSGSSNNSNAPSSAIRRSGLPRPVSMMHSLSPTSAGGMQPFPRSASSRMLASTPSRQPQSRHLSNGTGTGHSVLDNRGKRLEATHTASPSPARAKPELWSWITALTSSTADLGVFRRLARLSAEIKVSPTAPTSDGGEEGDETVLRPGLLSNSANRTSDKEGEGFTSDIEAWLEGGLFSALLDGLKKYLKPTEGGGDNVVGVELQMSAQVVLHRMVEYQFPLFGATGKEREVVELTLECISTLSSTSTAGGGGSSSVIVARKAAIQGHETILKSWATVCDPVLGLDLLLSSSTSYLSTATSTAVTAAVLRSGLTPILLRLPSELLLEDFLPRLSEIARTALKAQSTDLRLVATTMLKSLNDKLRKEGVEGSHDRIFTALGLNGGEGGENKALLDVLMYYFSKK
ncbi:related to STU1-component of the mitotic spindle [Ustilago bromivora]|uniref:Related to STU1 - component of the mitotic spindle n=1 Tax=Ustilago bromivora TaxID=307758 RepID=A0A1K0G7V5_9BASI|nr:related to STU1-component of the mitotic spindle [Ustilago bromivora]SYW73743.1 related to STU1 - component of the mitotic spindle [Ustilago bromivora]